jgi:hypothetical protein
MRFKKLLMSTFVYLTSCFSMGAVWPSENQWSDESELAYSRWVESSWHDEVFMQKDSILYGLKTDCADASYTMRALFAYLHKLPFQVYDSKSKTGFLTNETVAFDSETDAKNRFIKFLNKLNDITDSGSLSRDTYPIEISPRYFRPGIVYVSPNDHTYQIIKINENGVPTIMSSTVPKEQRYLQIIHSFPSYMPVDFIKNRDGYRMFKQPQHYKMKAEDLPGYSLEQYEISTSVGEDIVAYGDKLAQLLQKRPETANEKVARGLLNLCSAVQLRANVVVWTIHRKRNNNNICLNPKEYDAESTPSRDKKIKMIYAQLKNLYDLNETDFSSGYTVLLNEIYDENSSSEKILAWCPFSTYGDIGVEISLRDVWEAIQKNKLISDPNANMKQRWGLQDYAPICPTY